MIRTQAELVTNATVELVTYSDGAKEIIVHRGLDSVARVYWLDISTLYHGDVVEIKEEDDLCPFVGVTTVWTVNQVSPFGGLAIPEERICVPHRLGTLVSLYRQYILEDRL